MTKILIVDDSATVRKLLIHTLKPKHYTCIEACDGFDALEKLALNPDIKLIISDLNMPNMDGSSYHNIRQNPQYKDLPIIMLTTRRPRTTGGSPSTPGPILSGEALAGAHHPLQGAGLLEDS